MNFGLVGAAGYVAPRHMKAIKDTGNDLKVALDVNDSVGILDSYFPECKFFTQVERFDRHIVKNEHLNYISVCSPNYLHESHSKLGMRLGADIICEKPLAMATDNLTQLQTVEEQTGKKVYTILQLRLHPSIKLLKHMINRNDHYIVTLDYITPRGPWYHYSWKGNELRSGGIETNIGIHFFDVLIWLFGKVQKFEITVRDKQRSVGIMELERANVTWNLSIDRNDLPNKEQKFYRQMVVNGEPVRFDNVFAELHTESYREILSGKGYGINDTWEAVKLVQQIREST